MSKMVYLLYSSTQNEIKRKVHEKLGKQYRPGLVLVNGEYKQFTEMVSAPNKASYSDAIIVTSGDQSEMKIIK